MSIWLTSKYYKYNCEEKNRVIKSNSYKEDVRENDITQDWFRNNDSKV